MRFSRISVTREVAERLRSARSKCESLGELIERLLDDAPARTVAEWLRSLAPLEGSGVYSPEERMRLWHDQLHPRDSYTRRIRDR